MKSIQKTDSKITELSSYFDDTLSSRVISEVGELELGGTHEINNHVMRPDMISWQLYKTYEYDWILQLYNGLQRSEFTRGRIISYPTQESINNFLVKYNDKSK